MSETVTRFPRRWAQSEQIGEYGEEYHRVNDWVWSEESGFTKEEREYYFTYTD